MSDELPEGFPFPDDKLLYWTGFSGQFDPYRDSYTAITEIPEESTIVTNGKEHNNTHRLVIHTPVRGPVSLLTRPLDMEGVILAAFRLAKEGENTFGGKGEIRVNKRWLEANLGDVEIVGLDDE